MSALERLADTLFRFATASPVHALAHLADPTQRRVVKFVSIVAALTCTILAIVNAYQRYADYEARPRHAVHYQRIVHLADAEFTLTFRVDDVDALFVRAPPVTVHLEPSQLARWNTTDDAVLPGADYAADIVLYSALNVLGQLVRVEQKVGAGNATSLDWLQSRVPPWRTFHQVELLRDAGVRLRTLFKTAAVGLCMRAEPRVVLARPDGDVSTIARPNDICRKRTMKLGVGTTRSSADWYDRNDEDFDVREHSLLVLRFKFDQAINLSASHARQSLQLIVRRQLVPAAVRSREHYYLDGASFGLTFQRVNNASKRVQFSQRESSGHCVFGLARSPTPPLDVPLRLTAHETFCEERSRCELRCKLRQLERACGCRLTTGTFIDSDANGEGESARTCVDVGDHNQTTLTMGEGLHRCVIDVVHRYVVTVASARRSCASCVKRCVIPTFPTKLVRRACEKGAGSDGGTFAAATLDLEGHAQAFVEDYNAAEDGGEMDEPLALQMCDILSGWIGFSVLGFFALGMWSLIVVTDSVDVKTRFSYFVLGAFFYELVLNCLCCSDDDERPVQHHAPRYSIYYFDVLRFAKFERSIFMRALWGLLGLLSLAAIGFTFVISNNGYATQWTIADAVMGGFDFPPVENASLCFTVEKRQVLDARLYRPWKYTRYRGGDGGGRTRGRYRSTAKPKTARGNSSAHNETVNEMYTWSLTYLCLLYVRATEAAFRESRSTFERTRLADRCVPHLRNGTLFEKHTESELLSKLGVLVCKAMSLSVYAANVPVWYPCAPTNVVWLSNAKALDNDDAMCVRLPRVVGSKIQMIEFSRSATAAMGVQEDCSSARQLRNVHLVLSKDLVDPRDLSHRDNVFHGERIYTLCAYLSRHSVNTPLSPCTRSLTSDVAACKRRCRQTFYARFCGSSKGSHISVAAQFRCFTSANLTVRQRFGPADGERWSCELACDQTATTCEMAYYRKCRSYGDEYASLTCSANATDQRAYVWGFPSYYLSIRETFFAGSYYLMFESLGASLRMWLSGSLLALAQLLFLAALSVVKIFYTAFKESLEADRKRQELHKTIMMTTNFSTIHSNDASEATGAGEQATITNPHPDKGKIAKSKRKRPAWLPPIKHRSCIYRANEQKDPELPPIVEAQVDQKNTDVAEPKLKVSDQKETGPAESVAHLETPADENKSINRQQNVCSASNEQHPTDETEQASSCHDSAAIPTMEHSTSTDVLMEDM